MKKVLSIIVLLVFGFAAIFPFFGSELVSAQVTSSSTSSLRTGADLPSACRATPPANVFIKTGSSSGLYYCSATNTWTPVGGSGTGAASNGEVLFNNAGAVDGISNVTSDGTTITATSPRIVTAIKDTNNNTIIGLSPTSSADDYVNIANGTSDATISAAGADTNIDLILKGKGTGTIWTQSLLYNRWGTGGDNQLTWGTAGNAYGALWSDGTASLRLTFGSIRISDLTASTVGYLDSNKDLRSVSGFSSDGTNITAGGTNLRITANTPASAASSCTQGTISVDANFFYYCTATNTWKRAALSTW